MFLALMLVASGCGSDDDEPDVSPDLPLSVGGLRVAEPTGEVPVLGLVLIDSSGPRFCSALAESFPPQCGGESVVLVALEVADLELREEQGVSWTDLPVVLIGTYEEGTFTVTAVG